jgi:hypothetical protein
MLLRSLAPAALAATAVSAPALGEVLFDQIGPAPFNPVSLTSSQFPIGDPDSAFTTVDNVTLADPGTGSGDALRITSIEATVARLSGNGSFNFLQSWTVQIYSSLELSFMSLEGDVASLTFATPDSLTTGYASFFGDPVELAQFDVDIVVDPGQYWMTVAMENDGSENGTFGIAHSSLGDGSSWFSGPGAGASIPVSNAAGYRIFGEAVPGPGAAMLLAIAGVAGPRRRRDG